MKNIVNVDVIRVATIITVLPLPPPPTPNSQKHFSPGPGPGETSEHLDVSLPDLLLHR